MSNPLSRQHLKVALLCWIWTDRIWVKSQVLGAFSDKLMSWSWFCLFHRTTQLQGRGVKLDLMAKFKMCEEEQVCMALWLNWVTSVNWTRPWTCGSNIFKGWSSGERIPLGFEPLHMLGRNLSRSQRCLITHVGDTSTNLNVLSSCFKLTISTMTSHEAHYPCFRLRVH